MANHSNILAWRTPWRVWKGKKIRHWKMSPSGQKVSNMLLGKSRGQLQVAPERMNRLDQSGNHKEGWAQKNWCFQTVMLEKTLEGPLDCKAIKPVSPKGNQPWVFTGRTDTEAEAPILWPPNVKNYSLEKNLMLAKIKAGEGGDRGRDGQMASLPQWIWVWENSRR